jgi:hypothetical protein
MTRRKRCIWCKELKPPNPDHKSICAECVPKMHEKNEQVIRITYRYRYGTPVHLGFRRVEGTRDLWRSNSGAFVHSRWVNSAICCAKKAGSTVEYES